MKKHKNLGTFFLILGVCSILILSVTSGSFAKKEEVAPTVSITSPVDGAKIYEDSLNVVVNFGPKEKGKGNVRTIKLKLDGKLVATHDNPAHIKEGTYTFILDITDLLSDGKHTLQALAYQAEERAMLEGSSEIVTFTFISITRQISIMEEICEESQGKGMEAIGWLGADARHKLVEIGKPAIPKILEVVQDKTKDGRMRYLLILEVLPQIKDERTLEPLVAILGDENEQVGLRSVAALALACLKDERSVDPLLRALESEHGEIRESAARVFFGFHHPRAVKPLIEMLRDESAGATAARALGLIGDPRAIEPLIEVVEDHTNSEAVIALGYFSDERSIELLKRILKDDEYKDWRTGIVESLGRLGQVEPLIEALKDKDSLIQVRTARALGEIGDPKAIDPLKELLSKTEDEYVKETVIRALKKLK